MISVRRDLHQTPEIGMCEFITRDKIINYLNEIGIPFYTSKEHTGVVAYINSNNATKTIALRADIDALPINEENNSSYKSIHSGYMHACGHDAHTAILLGTIKVLYSMKDDLGINLKFFFQPAEETDGGAIPMINEGCMKDPYVDYTLGLHVMPHIECGQVEVKYDCINASTDTINIKIIGKDGHGAYPHLGCDAILTASHVINALQSIVSRNINPTDSVVLSFGVINGGVRANIICNEVNLVGTLRTLHPDTRSFCKKRIKDICEFTCKSFGCDCVVDICEGYAPLINDNFVVDIIKDNVVKLLGENNLVIKKHPSLGADDFAFFLEHSKGAFYHLGCGNKLKDITSSLHTSTFDIDEDCLEIGVKLHVENVLSLAKL